MRYLNSGVASAAGIGVATAYGVSGPAWPAVSIALGALTTALVLLLWRGGRKHYTAAGTALVLGTGVLVYATGLFPEAYGESAMAAMLLLGGVSGVIVVLQEVSRLAVRRAAADRVGGDAATAIFDAISAVVGLLGMVWTVLTFSEKAARYGGVGIGGTTMLVLNVLGVELPIPLWIVNGTVDATILLFVGSVLIGFHSLESLHTTWRASKATASTGASAGKSIGSKAAAAAKSRAKEGE